MAYDTNRLMVFGASGVLIAALTILCVILAPSFILPAVTKSEWYTEIEATFNVHDAHSPGIERESLVVKNKIAKAIFPSIESSVEVEEEEKKTPPTGVVNFTTIATFLDESGGTVWSYVSHLAGFGRKRFLITLAGDVFKPGETYTVRFTTTLKVTPFADGPRTLFGEVELTRTFEVTFTLLDVPSRERLQGYVEKPGEKLDQDYYYWLLQILYEHKGSYFMDGALDFGSIEGAFEYVCEDIAYEGDRKLYGQREYFANASETIERGAGDCEDKVILFASTLYWKALDRQARVVVGEVLGRGHAWVEIGDYVYDPTNNIIAPKSDYYTYITVLYFYFTFDDFSLLTDAEASVGS